MFVFYALCATLGTWLLTALGAGVVIFFKSPKEKVQNLLLGASAGVMLSASFWSLLLPAEERIGWQIAPFFLLGALFMWGCDKLSGNVRKNDISMLILSITLHNIPEGLAVGVAFGAIASGESLAGAVSLAVGIALQNFPEGAAVSLPMRKAGFSRGKSFLYGQASGLVEPVAGVLGALWVQKMQFLLPYALSFAAGAMILVAVHELIPESQEGKNENPYFATFGILSGFALMTFLDVLLG